MSARAWLAPLLLLGLAACGGGSTSPTGPSAPTSFLTGTWRGTLVLQVNPGDPQAPPPTSGAMEWTFEALPETNLQSFRASVRSDHPWLTMTTTGTTAITPGNTAPAQISSQGEFTSPRGCRGTFGSVGRAETRQIEADFTGTDCAAATFAGRVVLVKSD
jgi:hypothetical protein